jgi:hypothetical protein
MRSSNVADVPFALSRRQSVSFIPNLTKYGGRLYFLPRKDPHKRPLENSRFLHTLTEQGALVFNVKGTQRGLGADSLPDPTNYHRVIDDLRFTARAIFPCLDGAFEFSSPSEFRKHDLEGMCLALAKHFPEVASRNSVSECTGGRSRSASLAHHLCNVMQGGCCFVLRHS